MKLLPNLYGIPEDKYQAELKQFNESKAQNCLDGQYEAKIACAETKIRLLERELKNLKRENRDLKTCIKVLRNL